MCKKRLLILDTSFKSSFCYPTKKNPDIKKHFDKVLVNIGNEFDDFEGDYEFIETSFSLLEYIGCGRFLLNFSEAKKIEIEKCFLSLKNVSDAIKNGQSDEQCCYIVDEHIQQVYDRLVFFFMYNVDLISLVLKANQKLSRFSVHENVIEIENCLLDWINDLSNNGRDSFEYNLLCVHFAWNMMVRHKWCENEIIHSYVINRLIGFYADPRQFEHNLPGSALFGVLKGLNFFKSYGELLDPSLIDLACRGYFNVHLNKWESVIVLSADLGQPERLKNYITGANDANSRLGRNAIVFNSGFFILVDQDGLVVPNGVINIAKMIADIH